MERNATNHELQYWVTRSGSEGLGVGVARDRKARGGSQSRINNLF